MELLLIKKRSLISDDNSDRKRKKQEHEVVIEQSKYGDGMAWFRGCLIGKGCFGSVFMANLKKPKSRYTSYYPPIMAVKSAEVSVSSSIQKEREVLNNIRGCRNVIRCFGEEITNGENNQMVYNLLLEYGSGGTLADLIKKSGGFGLPELDAKRYTRSILRGLRHIHHCGYVHCDLKPDNILLVCSSDNGCFTAKIGDFGLAKRAKQSKSVGYRRGTPMYFSPEVVIDGVQEAPSDIWAIGCVLLEMLTGKPPWDSRPETDGDEVLSRIGENESPCVPVTVSREGRSFLKGCFSRKAMYRWTAEMLLAHPFLEGVGDDEDDDRKDEEPEVLDINAISSSMMSESEDDEISYSSFSDGYEDEDELYFWSEEEDDDGIENEMSSCFSVEESLQAERSTSTPLNEVHQYPISFTISGV